MDTHAQRYAAELLDATAGLDPQDGLHRMHATRRRNSVATALAVVLALLIMAAIALPLSAHEAAPPADQGGERVLGSGLSVAIPQNWRVESRGDTGFRALPTAESSEAAPYIQTYTVRSVWNQELSRLEDLPAVRGAFSEWLRSYPALYSVEETTPVTVAGQTTATMRFRRTPAAPFTDVAMLEGPTTTSANGVRVWPRDRAGLVTPLTFNGWTVIVEAVLPADGIDSTVSAADVEAAYENILRSAQIDPTWEWAPSPGANHKAATRIASGITFPVVRDWSGPEGDEPTWSLTDRRSAGPRGLDQFLSIQLVKVWGVPDSTGACCVTPTGGLGHWLERDSGLTVVAKTPVDIQQPTAVYELVAPGKDPGQVSGASLAPLGLWQVGTRPAKAPTQGLLDPADQGYRYEVDRGARLLVAPFLKDQQWFALVVELPYLPVQQTPTRPVEQLRADFLAIADGLTW